MITICRDVTGLLQLSIEGSPDPTTAADRNEAYDCSGGVCGLIFYNPTSREGAEGEADYLESGMEAAGSQLVIKKPWTTKQQLAELIREKLEVITCKLLLVGIMSHGTAGVLRCEDDDHKVVFNDVLLEFTRRLPKEIPMVRSRKHLDLYSG